MKRERFRYTRAELCNKLKRCDALSKAQTQVKIYFMETDMPHHGTTVSSQFKLFNTVFKYSCYHLNRSTMFLLDMFSFKPYLKEDLKGKVAFSHWEKNTSVSSMLFLTDMCLLTWLFFLLWLTFPLQTENSMPFLLWFCALLASLNKYTFTGRRTHLSLCKHLMQTTIFLHVTTQKQEYHSLSYMFPRSDLLHISS